MAGNCSLFLQFGIPYDVWGWKMRVAQPDHEIDVQHELQLSEARRRSDELFDLVRLDSLYERPIAERHRIVFYIGHLEAFDWNLLRERLLGLKPFHSEFDRLFAFGIDPVGGSLPSDQPSDWPSLAEVRGYVRRVRETLDHALEGLSGNSEGSAEFPVSLLLNVAIEHRLMHAETLTYMLHQLPLDRKIRQAGRPELIASSVTRRMIEIPAGSATLGLSRASGAFGWDNEFEQHSVSAPAFAVDQFKTTNGEFLEFMAAGGYENPAFWTVADWQWRCAQNICKPVFWRHEAGRWLLRTMFDEIPLPSDWPVYVSHAEASAYARWAGKSLPTEAQWHRVAFSAPDGMEQPYPWGAKPPDQSLGNFDFHSWDPVSVGAFSQGQSAFGAAGLLGNGWEWTSTVFMPFAGFEPFPFYLGYSADFFDGKHYVMKGGSPRTAARMLRGSFRNWFQPHYQYVFAGFRCVRN
ncbi:MAG TPA: SUMF1/EgtB/PvdO family nonheme iron enzyme [Terriglobales bacterium]|nr:SUMF1/EgtB/PvdO family nonheme iron enzyme [Terriglobales bacterium]